MKFPLLRFLREEEGQDLTEYSLLLAFVCLGAAAIFTVGGQSIAGIWTAGNGVMANANKAAAS